MGKFKNIAWLNRPKCSLIQQSLPTTILTMMATLSSRPNSLLRRTFGSLSVIVSVGLSYYRLFATTALKCLFYKRYMKVAKLQCVRLHIIE